MTRSVEIEVLPDFKVKRCTLRIFVVRTVKQSTAKVNEQKDFKLAAALKSDFLKAILVYFRQRFLQLSRYPLVRTERCHQLDRRFDSDVVNLLNELDKSR